jgi:hypothetical protein
MCYNKDTEREVIKMKYWINYRFNVWKMSDEKPESMIFNHRYHGEQKYEWTEVDEKTFLHYLIQAYEDAEG